MELSDAKLEPNIIVAWDFDGVINRNIENGRFIWSDTFEADIGHSLDEFTAKIFHNGFDDVITGKVDLRDHLEGWARSAGYSKGVDALISYWFKNDALPDAEVTAVMDMLRQKGIRQVIVTNNEVRRAAFIEREMGFADRVEHLFSSGRMGVRKPNPAFFEQVTSTLGADPEQMLLIDDCPKNVPAAVRCGWRAFHFTDSTRNRLREVLGLRVRTH